MSKNTRNRMRIILLISLLFPAAIGQAQPPATNLVDILPRIEAFGQAMGIDLPRPLTVASVTRWHPYRGPWPPPLIGYSQVTFGQQQFTWDMPEEIVGAYIDMEHASVPLQMHPEHTPDCLLAVEKGAKFMTTNEAITMAERILGNLAAVGYKTNWCGAMSVTRAQWKEQDLPVYDFAWQWTRTTNDVPYMELEIDGLRRKPTRLFSMQGSMAEQQLDGKRMPWSEPDQ
jgi:hypothetical protein